MKEYNLPTREKCFEIIKQCCVPPNIVEHCLTVAKLAVFLAKRLKETGVTIDAGLVDRACLLHDILRICDLEESAYEKLAKTAVKEDKVNWDRMRAKYKGIWHEDAACELLKVKYPVLALTIKRHRYMAMLTDEDQPNTWEEKLVYYADMRVMHDRIVPLADRLKDGHKRNVYLHGSKAQCRIDTAKVDPQIYKLEKDIFEKIGLNPLEVTDEFINFYHR